MFSIIICSVKPELASRLEENIRATIGVECEILYCDNRGTGKGICQVYNEAAARAQFENLCFVHEDIAFHTSNWGLVIAQKLATPKCGVIGFAGSTVKTTHLTGWYVGRREKRQHFLQGDGRRVVRKEHNPDRLPFSPVVTLDGMLLFVRRAVWKELRFDENLLPAFHGYDLDLTIASFVAGYKNYVCNEIWVAHFSLGSFSSTWFSAIQQVHAKWAKQLPLSVEPLSERKWDRLNRRVEVETMRVMMKMGLFEVCGSREVKAYFRRHPLSFRSWRLWLSWWKYQSRKR